MSKKYNSKTIGLEKKTFPKTKQWAIDQDNKIDGYVKNLKEQARSKDTLKAKEAQEALAWLSKFNNEYYGAKVKKGDPTALHSSDELRKDCYNRSNLARNDIYGIADANNLMNRDENYIGESTDANLKNPKSKPVYLRVDEKLSQPQPVKVYSQQEILELTTSIPLKVKGNNG